MPRSSSAAGGASSGSPSRHYSTIAPSTATATATATAPSIEEVWDLWNEGSLYRLSQAQLQAFLTANGVTVDAAWKKTALVKQVEGIITADNPTIEAAVKKRAQEQAAGNQHDPSSISGLAPFVPEELRGELEFGGAVLDMTGMADADGMNDGKGGAGLDASDSFVDVQQAGLYSGVDGLGIASMVPRACQLIHEDACPDVLVSRMNTTAFPSGNATYSAYTFVPANAKTANRARFQKAFNWCVVNMWNLNLDGELHISFGKMLLWHRGERASANELPGGGGEFGILGKDHNTNRHQPNGLANPIANRHISRRNHMTLWSAQQLMQGPQMPYSWLNLVHEQSEADVAGYCGRVGYEVVADPSGCNGEESGTMYRCTIKRQSDLLEADVLGKGNTYQTISLHHAWERFLATYYLRSAMPDARLQLRARPQARKKPLTALEGIPLLRSGKSGESKIRSSVPSELGEITSVVERETKSWKRPTSAPQATLLLNCNTTRVTMLKNKQGVIEYDTRSPRWDVELICPIPPQHTRLDMNTLSEELWAEMTGLASTLEKSTRAFGCLPIANE